MTLRRVLRVIGRTISRNDRSTDQSPLTVPTHDLRYGAIDIQLSIPQAEIVHLVATMLGTEPQPIDWPRRAGVIGIVLAPEPAGKGARDLLVSVDGVEQARTTFEGLAGVLVPLLAHEVLAREPNCLHLHAGVTVHDGRAVVIPGSSGRGKTQLSIRLARHGALLTDEMVSVDAISGTLSAGPRPLSVKPTGRNLVTGITDDHPPEGAQTTWWVPAAALGLTHAANAHPGLIVDSQRRRGPARIEPLHPAEAVDFVLQNSFDLAGFDPQKVRHAAWLVANSGLVRLAYEHADEGAELLAERARALDCPSAVHVLDQPRATANADALTVVASDRVVIYIPSSRQIVRLDPVASAYWLEHLSTGSAGFPARFAAELLELGLLQKTAT